MFLKYNNRLLTHATHVFVDCGILDVEQGFQSILVCYTTPLVPCYKLLNAFLGVIAAEEFTATMEQFKYLLLEPPALPFTRMSNITTWLPTNLCIMKIQYQIQLYA